MSTYTATLAKDLPLSITNKPIVPLAYCTTGRLLGKHRHHTLLVRFNLGPDISGWRSVRYDSSLGCDVSRRKVDVSLIDGQGVEPLVCKVPNTSADIATLLLTLSGNYPPKHE